jgi:hypothetical protein
MVSIAIPSKNEIFLQKTILDVLEKAKGEIEVFPILDGYEPLESELVDDPRVHYVRLEKTDYSKKRHGINKVVNEHATGKYVCWMDGHVMVAPGFDEVLVRDHIENRVQVPRRNRLDAENWCLQQQSDARPPIDYEHFLWKGLIESKEMHGFRNDRRTLERMEIEVDKILTCQGSFFFMGRDWFKKCSFMDIAYQGWGSEAEEVCFQTYFMGGEVVVNKKTWYAHLHKGSKYGRMYHLSKDEIRRSYRYSWNNWAVERQDFFISQLERFAPFPNYPVDWKNQLISRLKT